MSTSLDRARELDAADELASFRSRFLITDPDLIYLDGNSLGRLPHATAELVKDVVERQWGDQLIRSWTQGWYDAPFRIGEKIGKLLGARTGEVVVADSTSVNLFKLVAAALSARPGRNTVISDTANFPSDLYILEGAIKTIRPSALLELVNPERDDLSFSEDTALVTFSHTSFKRGYVYDMAEITRRAHDAGALVLWDLSHSAGSVPVDLTGSGADLAVGCTYKYLNGGPGAPAFLYVRSELHETLENPVTGWFGQADPFAFDLAYSPAPGLRRFLTGTPPTLSLLAVEPGVDLLLEAGMESLRRKSVAQTEFLISLWKERLQQHGVTLASPVDAARRGSHVSFAHPDGYRIDRALIEDMKVIPDFRHPDTIRFGVAPLYNTFEELHEAVVRLENVLTTRSYERFSEERLAVT